MIQTNELSIGNILKYNTEKMNTMYPEFYWRVTNIGVKSFKCKGHSGINFDPIPLSEEILLKVGFEKKILDRYSYFELPVSNTKFITDDNGKVRIGISGPSQYEYLLLEIEYLHQLQNLCFDLTGQELNINRFI